MKIGSVLRRLAVPALAVAGLVVAASPAVAAAAAPALNHYVGNIVTGAQKCYATEAEAWKFGTGERAATVALVTFYDGCDKGPASFTARGPKACTATYNDRNYSHPDMSRFGGNRNDRTSSVVTYSQCDIWFSSDIKYKGECGNRWIDSSMDLRNQSCNNRASSYDLT